MVYDLLRLGLFSDNDGRMSDATKTKLFEILGFGNWEAGRSAEEIHRKKAMKENLDFDKGDITPDVYDDHALHIGEHIKTCVSTKCVNNKELRDRVARHIALHTQLAGLNGGVSDLEKKFGEEKIDE